MEKRIKVVFVYKCLIPQFYLTGKLTVVLGYFWSSNNKDKCIYYVIHAELFFILSHQVSKRVLYSLSDIYFSTPPLLFSLITQCRTDTSSPLNFRPVNSLFNHLIKSGVHCHCVLVLDHHECKKNVSAYCIGVVTSWYYINRVIYFLIC